MHAAVVSEEVEIVGVALDGATSYQCGAAGEGEVGRLAHPEEEIGDALLERGQHGRPHATKCSSQAALIGFGRAMSSQRSNSSRGFGRRRRRAGIPGRVMGICEGTEQTQELVISRAISGLRIE